MTSLPLATKPKVTRKPPAHRIFEDQIVDMVYGQIIKDLIKEWPGISLAQLARRFSGTHGCTVSPSTMARWVKLMGYTFSRSTTWLGPDSDG